MSMAMERTARFPSIFFSEMLNGRFSKSHCVSCVYIEIYERDRVSENEREERKAHCEYLLKYRCRMEKENKESRVERMEERRGKYIVII